MQDEESSVVPPPEVPVVDAPLPPLPTEEQTNEDESSQHSNMDELMRQVAAAAMSGADASAFDS